MVSIIKKTVTEYKDRIVGSFLLSDNTRSYFKIDQFGNITQWGTVTPATKSAVDQLAAKHVGILEPQL